MSELPRLRERVVGQRGDVGLKQIKVRMKAHDAIGVGLFAVVDDFPPGDQSVERISAAIDQLELFLHLVAVARGVPAKEDAIGERVVSHSVRRFAK